MKSAPPERGRNFAAWDLSFLIDYIINTHHSYLRENLARIGEHARKTAQVHGARHPELMEIADIYDNIAAGLTAHLREEEEVYFPAVKRVEAAVKAGTEPDRSDMVTIGKSREKLDGEHEEVGDAVHAIRRLSADYALPDDACNTYTVTYRQLGEFEEDLHMHVHLENNILFPKVARLLDQP